MAVEVLKKRTAQIQLDNGVDSKGLAKYVTISLTGVSKEGWNADKYLAIIAALEPCLDNAVSAALTTATSVVSAS